MDIIDFFIGLTLMNAMPHFILGIYKGRMISVFGFGNLANIFYGLLHFAISIGLFLYKYGPEQLFEHGIYVGGLTLLVMYFLVGRLCYTYFHQKYFEKR